MKPGELMMVGVVADTIDFIDTISDTEIVPRTLPAKVDVWQSLDGDNPAEEIDMHMLPKQTVGQLGPSIRIWLSILLLLEEMEGYNYKWI